MNKPLLATGLALLAALLLVPAASAASITIKTTPSTGDYTMDVDVSSDFTLAPVSAQPVNAAHTGHIHYFVNGAPCKDACANGASYATPSKSFTFHNLAKDDKVSAELVNNDHSSLSPVVKQEQTVSDAGKSSPGVGPLFALGLLGLAFVVGRRQA